MFGNLLVKFGFESLIFGNSDVCDLSIMLYCVVFFDVFEVL